MLIDEKPNWKEYTKDTERAKYRANCVPDWSWEVGVAIAKIGEERREEAFSRETWAHAMDVGIQRLS